MATLHCYLAVENLNLTTGQRDDYWTRIAALGDNDNPNPSHRNHSVVNGGKKIFEAEFDDDEISTANLKTLLGLTLSVDPSTITAGVRETNRGIRIILTQGGQDKVEVHIFGYSAQGEGRPTKATSNTQALTYMAATWGGETLVSGIPRVDPDYTVDVDVWWSAHPLNPSAPYPLDIANPTAVIDVEVDHEGDLQAAIDAAGENGAKIVLGAVYYNGVFDIIAKSHLHFIGQEGTQIKTIRIYPEGTYGLDYNDWASAINILGNPNHAAALAIAADPPSDYYFSGIVFDGNDEPLTIDENGEVVGNAVLIRGVRDVLFDSCTFQNYSVQDPPTHIGPAVAHGIINNILFRSCTFTPPGRNAVYCDGLHGGGIVNSTFTDAFSPQQILYLTNSDFTYDYDSSGTLEDAEKKSGEYIVIAGNTFNIASVNTIIAITGQHVLIKDNVLTGFATYFAVLSAASRPSGEGYTFTDYQVLDNTLANCVYLVWGWADGGLVGVPPNIAGTMGDMTITGNTLTNVGGNFVDWLWENGNILDPVTVSGNTS